MMKELGTHQMDPDTVLDSLNDGVISIGLDKRIKYLNPAAERLLGYTLKEAQNQPCATIVHCAACENNCLLDQTLSTGRNITRYPTLLHNKQGRVVTVRTNTALLRDEEGRIIGGLEVIRDCSEVQVLTEGLKGKYAFENIIGKNDRMQALYDLLPAVAQAVDPVLIEGGLGTGKELVARSIHENGPRAEKPFVKIHCGSLAGPVLAGELFGHVAGASTGAPSRGAGRLQQADGGTLFLDEVDGLSPSIQLQLLRFLETGEVEPVGTTRKVRADIRVIASIHGDLKTVVEEQRFRRDLFDRLRAISIQLPLLRDRREDIPLLVEFFVSRDSKEMGKPVKSVTPGVIEALLNYDYPGNVRELENIVQHAVVLCEGDRIQPSHLPRDIFDIKDDVVGFAMKAKDPLKALERQLVLKVLLQTGWSHKEAAERLGVSRTTLWRKIKEFGIDRVS